MEKLGDDDSDEEESSENVRFIRFFKLLFILKNQESFNINANLMQILNQRSKLNLPGCEMEQLVDQITDNEDDDSETIRTKIR